MKVELIGHTPNPDWICAQAAAACRNKNPSLDILRKALNSGHYSLMEHATFTFRIAQVSRALTHQLVRHRIASYAQQSQRSIELPEYDWNVVPRSITGRNREKYEALLVQIRDFYGSLIAAGVPLEDARYILPNGAHTLLIMSMNGRELFSFFALRCCMRAQWEIRELADIILGEVKLVAPVIFENAGRQCFSCKEPCGKSI